MTCTNEYKSSNSWFDGCSHRHELDAPKQTNADRIRAMSDEELAEFLTDDLCELFCPTIPTVCDGQCETVALGWLRQEVET